LKVHNDHAIHSGPHDVVPAWVRIVIVNYNGGTRLQRVIDTLACQSMRDFEAVIVDNCSDDDSVENLRVPDSRFRIERLQANVGFARGCNLGASGSRAQWLAMLNPDAYPEPHWLARLRTATQRYPDVDAFGSTQLSVGDPSRLDGAGDCYSIFGMAWRGGRGAPASSFREDGIVFAACAAAALYRRETFQALSGFAEGFFCYLDDIDFGFRLRLAGGKCVQVADARVLHEGSAITGARSDFTFFHSHRNAVWVLARCMPAPLLPITLMLHLLATLWCIWRMRRRANPVPRLLGLLAGVRGLPLALWQRRSIQSKRTLHLLSVMRLMVWDPRKVSSSAATFRPAASASTDFGFNGLAEPGPILAAADLQRGWSNLKQLP
jgi:N-acetylglucosaminyl-diphospho-decaprenol L-rhamnosyltransferase